MSNDPVTGLVVARVICLITPVGLAYVKKPEIP